MLVIWYFKNLRLHNSARLSNIRYIMEYCAILKKATILYLEDYFTQSDLERSYVPLTPFHSAVTNGDLDFVKDILTGVSENTLRCVLNTRVASGDTAREAEKQPQRNIYSILFRPIRDRLTEREFRMLVERNKIQDFSDIPLQLCNHKTSLHHSDGNVFSLPLSLAATSKNLLLFETIIKFGAETHAVDNDGNNIVHDLVRVSDTLPEIAVQMLLILMGETPLPDRCLLLKRENARGMSPLDLAADLGLPEIMVSITNIEGAYKFTAGQCAIYKHLLYDLSEYESADAAKPSFFTYIVQVSEKQLFRFDNCKFFSKEPFRSWVKSTIENRYWPMTRWEILWTTYIVFIFVDLFAARNGRHMKKYIGPCLIFASLFTVLKEVVIFIMTRHKKVNMFKRRLRGHHPVSVAGVYRLFQVTLAVMVLWSKHGIFSGLSCEHHRYKGQLSAIVTTFFSIASLLYFFQMQLNGGYILIIIGKVVCDTFMFFTVCSAIYVGTCLSFIFTHNSPAGTESCAPSTSNSTDFGSTFYESFLFVSLVQAPADINFTDWANPDLAITLYIFGIVIIGIVMTNLLIALMTQRIQVIYDHRESLLLIEKLSMVTDLENITDIIFLSGFVRLLWKIYLWRWQRGKQFRHDAECTKAYLEVVENVTN